MGPGTPRATKDAAWHSVANGWQSWLKSRLIKWGVTVEMSIQFYTHTVIYIYTPKISVPRFSRSRPICSMSLDVNIMYIYIHAHCFLILFWIIWMRLQPNIQLGAHHFDHLNLNGSFPNLVDVNVLESHCPPNASSGQTDWQELIQMQILS